MIPLDLLVQVLDFNPYSSARSESIMTFLPRSSRIFALTSLVIANRVFLIFVSESAVRLRNNEPSYPQAQVHPSHSRCDGRHKLS